MTISADTVLPLRHAYDFAVSKGLGDEIAEIKSLNPESLKGSPVRRGYIIDLFKRRGYWSEFVEQHWPNGKTRAGETRVQRCEALRRQHQMIAGDDDAGRDSDLDDAIEQSFEFESHLRDYLAANLHVLEPGLRLYSSDGQNGIEYAVDSGRIDVLAVDSANRPVVIELKLSRGRNKTLGQILYYMGWVDQNLDLGPCRGFIVAQNIGTDLMTAARRAQGITLFEYAVSMTAKVIQ